MSLPIYQDTDHLYTVQRDGAQYALAMIPLDVTVGGCHIISAEGMDTLDDALQALREYAWQYQLKKTPRKRCNARWGREPDHHNDITTGRIAQ